MENTPLQAFDPNSASPPAILMCRSASRLNDGGFRLILSDARIHTIGGDFHIEEVLPDGIFRPLPR
jgi:hypothetical protein